MPNRQGMIDAIQREISDKTLSPGCTITRYDYEGEHGQYILKENYTIYSISSLMKGEMCAYLEGDEFDVKTISEGDMGDIFVGDDAYDYSIIGHPVMIGDVLDVYGWDKNQKSYYVEGIKWDSAEDIILELRKQKRLPLEEQDDELIKFLYDFIYENK